ncbi:hypothetical protein [Amycolatopsis sp. Hca4]|uniref:hypothetical protein n=1 Tax=Amycolatopsis sp. Hca4 TaxID=2742131 RepID=UPI0020CB0E6F|nr:hypothetical protein [Amycolatopsis sp. Hca4]
MLADNKVTSREQAIRLLVEHRVPGAADELAALWADLQLRRAIVSAAHRLLENERAWQWLTEATGMTAVATAVTEAAPPTIAEHHHRACYGALGCRRWRG